VPAFLRQANELKVLLQRGNGFFNIMPYDHGFTKWQPCCHGLAIEDNWKNDKWKYDLTFRSLLILKYGGLL